MDPDDEEEDDDDDGDDGGVGGGGGDDDDGLRTERFCRSGAGAVQQRRLPKIQSSPLPPLTLTYS